MDAIDTEQAASQIAGLFKAALETKSPDALIAYLEFAKRFRRFAPFNIRLIQAQRPGATIVASSKEWGQTGRTVIPDARPIIVLKMFGPVEWLYEVEDTLPAIERGLDCDPFAAVTMLSQDTIAKALRTLTTAAAAGKDFRVVIQNEHLGSSYAGSAASQGALPMSLPVESVTDAHMHVESEFVGQMRAQRYKRGKAVVMVPAYRVKVNCRMTAAEQLVTIAHELGHIFCGHLGASGHFEMGKGGWPDRSSLDHSSKELEAEAVAWLVATRAEIITGSAQYLRHHVLQADIADVDTDLVIGAVGRIERLGGLHYGRREPHPGSKVPTSARCR